jgi:arylsulfatase A-like enzyme
MRLFLLIASVIAGCFAKAGAQDTKVDGAKAKGKPNLVFMIADDLGYGDLGCYGQRLITTPRLDAMAAQGMRFTQFYAGAPSCHPSRCALFTGKHVGHGYIRGNSKIPLRPEDFTLSQMLSQAGYRTGGIGKWALGDGDTTGSPWQKGMDEFFGYLDQTHAHGYYPDFLWRNGRRIDIVENQKGQRKAYSHDLFVDYALDFIRRHQDQPFFFYGAFTIPHAEVTVPEDSLAEYRGRWPEPKQFAGSKTYCPQDEPRAVRAAMISRLDRDVGRILDLLNELKLSENTLVIFTSDNGPITAGGQDPEFFDSNGPLRDLKFTLREGGIRVPCLAYWPGSIAPGSTTHFVSDFADIMPTYAALTGKAAPDSTDGVSILPTLLGQTEHQKAREYHYWEAAPTQALRQGDWKLYRASPKSPVELYNLAVDLGETRDVASEHPEIVARLEALLSQAHIESAEFPLTAKKTKSVQKAKGKE